MAEQAPEGWDKVGGRDPEEMKREKAEADRRRAGK